MTAVRRPRLRHVPVAVALAALTACSPTSTSMPDTAASGGDTAVTSATGTTPARPSIVGLRDDAVVELDPRSADVVATHDVDPNAGLVDLALVRVRHAVVVTRRHHAGEGGEELVEVPLDDQAARVLSPGARPAVTADGAHLAFVRVVPGTDDLEVVAATFDGDELATWPVAEAPGEDLEVEGLSWEDTAERLAVTLTTSRGPQVWVLPVERDGTVRGAGDQVPPTSAGAVLRAATFRGPGVLTVAEGCCGDDLRRWRILDVTLGTEGTTELATGLDVSVRHLDWTTDRRDLLIGLEKAPPHVVRWPPPRTLDTADEVVSAEW